MRKYLTLVLLPAGLAVASLAFAGAPNTSQQAPSSQATSQISDATLLKFDRAVLAAHKVRQDYAQKVKAVSGNSQTTAQMSQQEKQAEAAAIAQYMPVAQFQQIKGQMRNDPQLRARAHQLANQHRADAGSPPSSTPPGSSPGQISDATLIKFDRAAHAVRDVRQEYAPKIKAATTDEEKMQLKNEGKQAEAAAVKQYMPVSQFKQVMKQVRHDPALKARAKKLAMDYSHRTASPNAGTK